MSHPNPTQRRIVSGYTLIEVLVGLIVLSIGLLGVAKLTLTATRANDSAYLRAQATELAYEIADQMRSNRTTAINGGYNIAFGATPGVVNCNAAACDSATLATYDLGNWKQSLQSGMPQGDGQITTATAPTTPETTATIVVQWNDAVASATFNQTAPGAAAPTSVTLETVL
jgi:type IV pilus assembly protein PilV